MNPNLFLFEDLPLRTTRVLGDFAEDKVLPHRYGDLTGAQFPLIRLSDSKFFAADHPMEVTKVFTDRLETASWEPALESDEDGNTWTIVNMGAPVPKETVVTACGKGKLNPKTGALLENPGEILQDIYRLGGRTDDWGQLRAEASAAGLAMAGSVTEAAQFGKYADDVTISAGAIWIPGMSRLYPTTDVIGPIIDLDKMTASGVSASASIQNTADILRLGFDVAEATGKAQRFIQLEASPQRFGGVVREMTLDWLRQAANAEPVARRYLEYFAGERYDVQFSTERTDVLPGRWVRLVAHPEWEFDDEDDPVMMVVEAVIDPQSRTITAKCKWLRSVPAITVTAHSVGLPDTGQGAVEVSTKNGITTITLVDQDGRPVAGARVQIDGGQVSTTDQRGQVQFIVPPGSHTLAVEMKGFAPLELVIETG